MVMLFSRDAFKRKLVSFDRRCVVVVVVARLWLLVRQQQTVKLFCSFWVLVVGAAALLSDLRRKLNDVENTLYYLNQL
jgi:hypothetical protein